MPSLPPQFSPHILLAEDDDDDSFLFKYALEDLSLAFELTIVHNGEELLELLNNKNRPLPNSLFLDLNMPRKNGMECLSEIKNNERLKHIPVIIFSTSISPEIVNQLYKNGAQYCIRKPQDVAQLKIVIYLALTLIAEPVTATRSFDELELPHEFYLNENQ